MPVPSDAKTRQIEISHTRASAIGDPATTRLAPWDTGASTDTAHDAGERESGIRPKRPSRRWLFLWLPLIASAVLAGDAFLRDRSFLRPDLAERLQLLLPSALGVLAAGVLATFLALWPDAGGRAEPRTALRWAALAVGPLSTLPALLLAGTGRAAPHDHALDTWGLPCFAVAYLLAELALVVLAHELRKQNSALTSWRSAALASAAGTWSALALLLHCPGAQPRHLLAGHVLPIALLPALALLLVRPFARRTATRPQSSTGTAAMAPLSSAGAGRTTRVLAVTCVSEQERRPVELSHARERFMALVERYQLTTALQAYADEQPRDQGPRVTVVRTVADRDDVPPNSA